MLEWLVLGSAESNLIAARNQMALTLGYHIIIACFGVAFPAMIFVAHRRGIRNDDPVAIELARRWSKVAAVLFAIGAVTGTVLSFEMGLLWPGLMSTYGDVMGLAFALEGISFFVEAIFIGIYLYGWDRIPPKMHSLMLVPIMVAGASGTFFVLSVNAWMNAPTGFDIIDGEVTNVDPLAAIFNSAVGLQYVHMFFAAYMVVGFCVAGVYAKGILSGRNDHYHRMGLAIPLIFACLITPIQPVVGHFAGQRLTDEQPIKLAAIEGLAETESQVPTILGGFYDGERIVGGIEVPIPGLGSFVATNSFDAELQGLNSVPEEDRPPVNVVRFSFQTMVAIGSALVGLVAWAALLYRKDRQVPVNPWFLRAVLLSGPAAIVALETGWITTEVGRQPWVVHELLRTEDAVTDAGWIWLSLAVIVVVYALVTVGGVRVIRSMTNRWRDGEKHLHTPYGPALPLADPLVNLAAMQDFGGSNRGDGGDDHEADEVGV